MAKRKKRAATARSVGKSGRQRNAAPPQSGELLGSAGLLQNGGQLQNDVLPLSPGQVPNVARRRTGGRPPSVQVPLSPNRPGNLTPQAPQWRNWKRRKRCRADCHQRKIRSQLKLSRLLPVLPAVTAATD